MVENIDNHDMGRRKFLRMLWIWWAAILVSKWLYDIFGDDKKEEETKSEVTKIKKINIKQKPINLAYKEIVHDKDIEFVNFPGNKWWDLARVGRCLRWKPVTDAVEDRYHIPRGLLMAMMAQEGLWDPTMPNLPRGKHCFGDWWLWLIHIQAINAYNFWLKTLPRYTDAMCDDTHAAEIRRTIEKEGNNIPKLLQYDDRFHPVMAVDCAARFLMDCRRRAGGGTDSRIHALRLYSGRKYSWIRGYWHKVIQYRAAINTMTGDIFPDWFSSNVVKDIQRAIKDKKDIKQKTQKFLFSIDGEKVGYQEYLAYFEESMRNFELEKYATLGDSLTAGTKEEIDRLPQKIQDTIEKPKSTRTNDLITEIFVDTHQHNSEWYILYRYKAKAGDTILGISNTFDAWDKDHGDIFKNTGNLNIVNFRWERKMTLKVWEVVYVKVRKNS